MRLLGIVMQKTLFGQGAEIPAITGLFAQVRYVLEEYPECRGDVGATVAKVWFTFYSLGDLIESGDSVAAYKAIAGKTGMPNYKTVSRNYHRVIEKFPDLAKAG